MKNPTTPDFRRELFAQFARAESRGESSVIIRAGDLHESVGGYPGTDHRMATCSKVMHDEKRAGDQVLTAPPSGKGASLEIKYKLPR